MSAGQHTCIALVATSAQIYLDRGEHCYEHLIQDTRRYCSKNIADTIKKHSTRRYHSTSECKDDKEYPLGRKTHILKWQNEDDYELRNPCCRFPPTSYCICGSICARDVEKLGQGESSAATASGTKVEGHIAVSLISLQRHRYTLQQILVHAV
jgi:hypothetical protein